MDEVSQHILKSYLNLFGINFYKEVAFLKIKSETCKNPFLNYFQCNWIFKVLGGDPNRLDCRAGQGVGSLTPANRFNR